MQKVYLLLRSNQQSGPYTLEELAAFDLKPVDLVWIEGKSAGWYYPQEIKALHPYLSFLSPKAGASTQAVVNPPTDSHLTAANKKVFVSMPGTRGAQPAEHHLSSVQPVDVIPDSTQPELKTTYTKSVEEVENEYMNWVYEKKQKTPVSSWRKPALAACLLGSAAVAGWLLLKPVSQPVASTEAPQSLQQLVGSENAGVPPSNQSATTVVAVTTGSKKPTTIPAIIDRKKNAVLKQSEQNIIATATAPTEQVAPLVAKEAEPIIADGTETTATEAAKEKKKLREKIIDLFKKKPEEAKPAEVEKGNRQSTRREAGSSLAQLVTVRFTIPNDWMMGIKGAKATLTNRSSETLASATVEVVYYNDDNEVLTKRTITFQNIKSKGTAVATIPDHATATRVEYNVLSATGVGEPLASR